MMGELVLMFSTANPSCFLNFYLQPHLSTEHHLVPLFSFPSSGWHSYATLFCATTTCNTSFMSLIVASFYLRIFFMSSWRGLLYLHPEELAGGIPTTSRVCVCVCVYASFCFLLYLSGLKCTAHYYYRVCAYSVISMHVNTCMCVYLCVPACKFGFIKHDYFQTGHKYPWWPKYKI